MLRTLHRRKNLRDPYFDKCVLLLRGDDADGVASLVDHSKYKRSVTIAGNVQVDTAQSKFGGASILLDGVNDYFQLADSDDWEPVSGGFMFSEWIRPAGVGAGLRYLASRQTSGTPTSWVLLQNGSAISLYLSFNNSTWTGNPAITGGTLSANTWHHVAWTRVGNDYKLWLDGSQVGSTYTNSSSFTNASTVLRFGAHTTTDLEFTGHMDDIRIYKGVDVPIAHLMKQSCLN